MKRRRTSKPSRHTAEINERTEASKPKEGLCDAATGRSSSLEEERAVLFWQTLLIGTKIIMAVFVKKIF